MKISRKHPRNRVYPFPQFIRFRLALTRLARKVSVPPVEDLPVINDYWLPLPVLSNIGDELEEFRI
jgi:hypothetical protein